MGQIRNMFAATPPQGGHAPSHAPNSSHSAPANATHSSTLPQNVTLVPYVHTPVSKWPLKFTGRAKKDDPKAIECVNEFFELIEDRMEAHKVSGQDILDQINLLLDGPARQYLLELRSQGIGSWPDLRAKFLKRFANLTEDNVRHEIYTRKQKSDERTLDFVYEMCALIRKLPNRTDEHTRLEMVFRGLDSEVAKLARARNVLTISVAKR